MTLEGQGCKRILTPMQAVLQGKRPTAFSYYSSYFSTVQNLTLDLVSQKPICTFFNDQIIKSEIPFTSLPSFSKPLI